MEYREYEDITSNSKKEEFVDLSSMSSNYRSKHYKKKKRGIAGFFERLSQRISKWWRKASKPQKAAVISLSSVIAVLLAGIIFIATFFNYNYNSITKDPDELGFDTVINEKVINIALFGIDTRSKGFKGNSDSIMVLSLNTETKQVKIVSIMRDSLVKIVHNGKTRYNKINSAYALGGPELAIKTINENFGLDISEYATVNFEGMADIIDAVGGVDAELTKGEVVSENKSPFALNGCIKDICSRTGENPKKYYIYEAGKHHLNGVQAVAYSRIRKTANIWGTNNDHGRTDRQRYVMEQLFNKAVTLKKSDYIKLVKALIPCCETSLSYTQIIGLATNILLKSPIFTQSRVPMDDYQITKGVPNIKGVGSIVYYDINYVTKLLYAYFYEDITPELYIEQNGVEKNNWYKGQQISSSTGSSANQSSKPTVSSKPSTSSSSSSSTVESSSSHSSSSEESSQTSESEPTTPPAEEIPETPPTSSEETTTTPSQPTPPNTEVSDEE